MTRDEIIKALDWHAPSVAGGPQSLLRRIEKLVAMAEAAEREACAKVCDPEPSLPNEAYIVLNNKATKATMRRCARAIRARGEKK